MAYALVQSSTETSVSAGSSGNATLTGVVAGNLLVATLAMTGSAIRTFTFSDDAVNTWAVAEEINSGQTAHISFAKNVLSGTVQVTATINTGTGTFRFKVHEFSGGDTVSPLDTTSELLEPGNTNNHACSANATVIDTVADALVVCVGVLNSAGGATVEGGTYTNLNSSATTLVIWQYKVASGALANEQGAWTNTTTARTGRSVIASFKPAAGGGSTFPHHYYQQLRAL
jgi:hypothetical protein